MSRSPSSTRPRDRQGPPFWLFVLPTFAAVVVGTMQARNARRGNAATDPIVTVAQQAPVDEPVATPVAPSPVHRMEAPRPEVSRAAPSRDAAPRPVALRGESVSPLLDRAREADRAGRTDEALDAALACLARAPNDPDCIRIGAATLLSAGHFDDARPLVQRCLEATPDDPNCLSSSARLAMRDGDLAMAGITSWRIAQIAPDSLDAYMTRGRLAELMGNSVVATQSYRSACSAGSQDACHRLGDLVASGR